jgi:hypothetical protein
VQPSNDITSLLEKHGDRLAIIGGYDTQGFPGREEATEEEVKTEVRRCFCEYAKHKGYVFFGVRVTSTLDPALYRTGMLPMIEEAIKCSMMAV